MNFPYHNPRSEVQVANVRAFMRIAKRYEWMGIKQPNSEKAPWHFQGCIPTASGEKIVFDFWPHKGKAASGGEVFVGEEEIRSAISMAIDESSDEDFGAVLE